MRPLLVWTGQAALMGKVMLVLAIELAVLPVAYGFWLDICALPLVQGRLAGRVALLQHAPVAWTLLHWLLGMACLMATAAFLSLIRATLRSGVVILVSLTIALVIIIGNTINDARGRQILAASKRPRVSKRILAPAPGGGPCSSK